MLLVREIIEPLSINREFECPACGMHYRAQYDQGCPRCLYGEPEKLEEETGYRGPTGTRKEQQELSERVCALYQEEYPKLKRKTAGYVGAVMGIKKARVWGIILRSRNRGLL